MMDTQPNRRRTKIVATLGPATDDPAVLRAMVRAGMDVARVNFSHGRPGDVARRVQAVRDAAAACDRHVGVLGDLQGPKLRIQRFLAGSVMLEEGAAFALDPATDPNAGTAEVVGVAYVDLADDLSPGDTLLLDDGQIVLQVTAIKGRRIETSVQTGGVLKDHKGLNRLGGGLSATALTDKDITDIRTAAELEMDFVAVSFVRDAADMETARALLREHGSQARLVAKIERTEAIAHLSTLIAASDVIMVARGDLGVEMGYAELPGIQKRMINSARNQHRLVITATQMMESMISNAIPTRAEVSDVANAVIDGTDAVMLSAETAVGRYPVKAIEAMAQVCVAAEKHLTERGRTNHRMHDRFDRADEAIAMAVMYTANHLPVRAIIALTESGATTRWMSRIRSDIPIYAFTPHLATARRVTLYRGVYPVHFDIAHTDSQVIYRTVFDELLRLKLVNIGDRVIFTKGDMRGVSGQTNAMKLIEVTAGSAPAAPTQGADRP